MSENTRGSKDGAKNPNVVNTGNANHENAGGNRGTFIRDGSIVSPLSPQPQQILVPQNPATPAAPSPNTSTPPTSDP